MDLMGSITGRGKKDAKTSAKDRALKKRLLRKFDGKHLTSANIDVSQVDHDLDEDQARIDFGRYLGIAPDKVDLDKPYGDGVQRRAARRASERAAAKQKRSGRKSFNRQEREGVARREKAEAMHRLQGAETPMGDNIRAAVAQREKVIERAKAKAEG